MVGSSYSAPSLCFPSSLWYFWWHGKYFLPASFYETLSKSGRWATACTYLGFPNAWHGSVCFASTLLLGPRHPSWKAFYIFTIMLIFTQEDTKDQKGLITCLGHTASCLWGWDWGWGEAGSLHRFQPQLTPAVLCLWNLIHFDSFLMQSMITRRVVMYPPRKWCLKWQPLCIKIIFFQYMDNFFSTCFTKMYVFPNVWSCRTLHGKINGPNRFHCKPHPAEEGFSVNTHGQCMEQQGPLLGLEDWGWQSSQTSFSKGVCWGGEFLGSRNWLSGRRGCSCPGVMECSQQLSLLYLSLYTGRALSRKASP
jgi:hypothetical protein